MLDLYRELYSRNRVLAITGTLHLFMFAVALVLSFVDDRLIFGINGWIKPMKFMLSLTIYLWTLGWLLHHVRDARIPVAIISWGASIAMVVETVCLFIQASRGVHSHYNVATAFDGAIFGMMGMMIAFNSALIGFMLLVFLFKQPEIPPTYLWGIRFGLAMFLLGSYWGTIMIANMAHTVGAPDGGPGLPFVNWSTNAGDLRIAHALGLHGMQVLPLVGYLISRWDLLKSALQKMGALLVITALYAVLAFSLYYQALRGEPLLTLGG